jgi:hypothetical protein
MSMFVLNFQVVAIGTIGKESLPVTVESLLKLLSLDPAFCLLPEIPI